MKLCQVFNIEPIEYYEYQEEIINLPINSYSKTSVSKLMSRTTPYWDIQAINQQRIKYQTICSKLNIKPIQNFEIIEELLQFKQQLDQVMKIKLLQDTVWGKRIMNKFHKKYSENIINYKIFSELLFSDNPGIVKVIKVNRDNYNIAYIPVIKYFIAKNLDITFLHENRHITETHDIGCGIYEYSTGNYKILNEIRTQKCAHIDEKKFSFESFLFGNKVSPYNVSYTYDVLFPFVYNLFENHQDVFNYCALHGKVKQLEKIFGQEEFKEYSKMLDDLHIVVNTPNFNLKNKDQLSAYHSAFYPKYQKSQQNSKIYLKK